MNVNFLGFDKKIPEESKLDAAGKYLPSPYYDDVHSLFKNYSDQIDKLILISNGYMDVNRKKIVKLSNRLSFDGDIIEIYDFDFDDKKLMNFLNIYTSYRNWLNLFIQSKNLELLKEFYYLFSKPYRERIEYQGELGDRSVLGVKNVRDMNNLQKVISNLDEDSYLISSTFEDCFYCIFAGEKIQNIVKSWEPRPWS